MPMSWDRSPLKKNYLRGVLGALLGFAVPIATAFSIGGSAPAAQVGSAYNFTPDVAGGTAPFTFTLGGALPKGLSFSSSTGAVTGTPTSPVNINPVITATDSSATPQTVSMTVPLSVTTTLGSLALSTTSFPAGAPPGALLATISGGKDAASRFVLSPADTSLNYATSADGTQLLAGLNFFTLPVGAAPPVILVELNGGASNNGKPTTFSGNIVALSEPALTALGTVAVANTAASNAAIAAGVQYPVTILFKAGMAADFSNLRVFNGSTQVTFFRPPERVVPGTSCVLYLALPGLAAGASLTLSYDALAPFDKSNGYATFPDFFDDFRTPTFNASKWATAGTVGRMSVQPRMSTKLNWTTTLAFAQAMAHVSPTVTALATYETTSGNQIGKLSLYNRQTGAFLAGPVDTSAHPWNLEYIPEWDYIVASPAFGTEGRCMVHRASDLSFVGFLQKSDGTGIASVCYAGPNQVISFPTTSTSVPFVTFYTVDWSTLTVGAAGRSVATPTTTEFTPQTPQGIAYDVSTGAFYTCGNGTSAERYILRYDISGATAAITGRWWNIPASVSAASAAGEPQGIFCDVSGALSMIGLDGTDNTKCSLFSLGLSYGASEISNAVYQNQGAGAFCWAPNIIASTAAALISQVPITGPVRSIFGMSRVSQAGTAASSNTPTFMSWGLQDATAARRLQFQESSTQNSFVKTNLLRNKNGGTSQDAVVTCTDIRTPSTYETRWDGTTVSYYQNPKADSPATGLLGNYTDNVPPLSDIGGMVEEMVCGTTSTNVTMGSGVLAYYIARGKQLPAGQPDPTFTVN